MLAVEKTPSPDRIFKVVFVGNSGVGKSSFIHRFCYDRFLVIELPCWPLSVRLLASSTVPPADRLMEVIILGRGAVWLFVTLNTCSPLEGI
uniref:Uncharacterized protein n=1 Tax=Strix occidentalis caurina TaxID=311401 RepID=A0A8D0FYN9_STROC